MSNNLKALLASGQDEAVSVNQRALVEKILARYSGEFTLFRELLQNADDASATTVELHFRSPNPGSDGAPLPTYSPASLPDLKSHRIAQMLVRNDGIVFRDQDWDRLKKIAEGNPDETKIGAFGVGFYSLFSVCDDPVVSSGELCLGFYWKDTPEGKPGDQLYVRKAPNVNHKTDVTTDGKPWTSFLMDLREAAPMPEPAEFARFLTTCLGFTQRITSVSMHFDGHLLFVVDKTLAPPRAIAVRKELGTASPGRLLTIQSVEERPLQLRARVSRWTTMYSHKPKAAPALLNPAATVSLASKMLSGLFSRPATPAPQPGPSSSAAATAAIDPFALIPVSLFLRTVVGNLKVSPTTQFNNEMLRATKKSLPSTTTYSLIWTGKDEFDASQASAAEVGKADGEVEARRVFAGLMSNLDTQGRVFIGFPTQQTTGSAASVAARFVSTVERESIDFMAAYVAQWNRDLLFIGGLLARTTYEEEMAGIAREYKARGAKLEADERTKLEERALHLIKFFTFYPSTPSPVVGVDQEASFFSSPRGTSLTLMSHLGPTPAHNVRLPNASLSGFIKEIPTVPDLVAEGAPRLMATLREKKIVLDISLDDVLTDLGTHALTCAEATAAFKWWIILASNRSYNHSLLGRLKSAAMIQVGSGQDAKILTLGVFRFFNNPKVIGAEMPLPDDTTLPFELSRSFQPGELQNVFQLQELGVAEWVKHLTSSAMIGSNAPSETNLLTSPHFAEKVLYTLAKQWPSLHTPRQNEVVSALKPLAFVPTRQGSRKPDECYVASVSLFEDLPIIMMPSGSAVKGPVEKVLLALGVRAHVELQLVFSRLLGSGSWSHSDVVKYLVSIRDTLSPAEVDRLRKTSWLPKEGEAKVAQPAGADGKVPTPKTVRYTADQLYEPIDAFRALELPVVDWPGAKWRAGSSEAKFLYELGLLRSPPVATILQLAASGDEPKRAAALRHFLDHYAEFGTAYSPLTHAFAFVPAIHDGQRTHAKPADVFSNPSAALLGLPILAPELAGEASRLKLAADPTPRVIVAAVIRAPPPTVARAKGLFAYLSSQVSKFATSEVAELSRAPIVPTQASATDKVEFVAPGGSFFSTDMSLPLGLRSLFKTVPDFGTAARPFLIAVGVKETPSVVEIGTLVVSDPARFYDLSGLSEKYLQVLNLLAANYASLPATLRSKMKLSPFFLGTKRLASTTARAANLVDDSDDDDDNDHGSLVFKLARANELVINDDPPAFRVFEGELLACPQTDALELLAANLGAQAISTLVKETYKVVGEPDQGSQRAAELRRQVAERTFLFLAERRAQYGKGELRHDAEWVQNHLQVHEVKGIELLRTVTVGQAVKRNIQEVSAHAKSAPAGIILYVARDLPVDYFEIASSVCKLVLTRQRNNDSLLFMTVLSTPLKQLKRRGYNVDRIINSRKAEREAADQRLREEQLRRQLAPAQPPHVGASPAEVAAAVGQLRGMFPDADHGYLEELVRQQAPPRVENAANHLLTDGQDYPRKQKEDVRTVGGGAGAGAMTSGATGAGSGSPERGGLFGNWSNQLKKRMNDVRAPTGSAAAGGASAGAGTGHRSLSGDAAQPPLGPRLGMRPPVQTGAAPSSTDAIKRNLQRAIQLAKPENAAAINNAVEKTQVRESQEAYCDSTAAANLTFVAVIAGMRFFVSKDVPGGADFVTTGDHHAAIVRFVTLVLRPVGEVFGVNPASLHVFHDMTGPLIAFNRGGSVFFNLRFFLLWHDAAVSQGHVAEALISNFHSLAHELAHNLVGPHNAEHSFYFSSLCEQYFERMAGLLARAGRDAPGAVAGAGAGAV